jgi:class 3 adenylate cyclase
LPERIEQVSGDGALFVAPSGIDESRVVADLLYGLPLALRDRNAELVPAARLRLRFALTRGLVLPGPAGLAGAAVISCFRLLDSAPPRAVLRDRPERELVTIISDGLFEDVAQRVLLGPRPADFRKVDCASPAKGFAGTAWLHLPAGSTCQT